jgi:hypothetical protein
LSDRDESLDPVLRFAVDCLGSMGYFSVVKTLERKRLRSAFVVRSDAMSLSKRLFSITNTAESRVRCIRPTGLFYYGEQH